MGEIINLRRETKRRARDAAAEQATENRARHGRTPGERVSEDTAKNLRDRVLDQARISDRDDT